VSSARGCGRLRRIYRGLQRSSSSSPATLAELTIMRQRAAAAFAALPAVDVESTSWVSGEVYESASADPRRVAFDHQGFLVVKGFASAEECTAMRHCLSELANEWVPGEEAAVFRTDEGQLEAQGSSDYFFGSSDRVHFFAEAEAVEEQGDLKEGITREGALNKVGHALHKDGAVFQDYSTSAKVAELVACLGWKDPVLPQSMYILKQPQIGGEVTSHQDSTFLYTTPRQTCLGLWLALHPATLENGCLWVRPGSHCEAVRRSFIRQEPYEGSDSLDATMSFKALSEQPHHTWEGGMPANSWPPPSDGLFEAGFVPVEVEMGDLVLFPGQLDHLSLPNYSSLPRHTYQLHMVEGPRQGIEWSSSNWLQYPSKEPFMSIQKY